MDVLDELSAELKRSLNATHVKSRPDIVPEPHNPLSGSVPARHTAPLRKASSRLRTRRTAAFHNQAYKYRPSSSIVQQSTKRRSRNLPSPEQFSSCNVLTSDLNTPQSEELNQPDSMISNHHTTNPTVLPDTITYHHIIYQIPDTQICLIVAQTRIFVIDGSQLTSALRCSRRTLVLFWEVLKLGFSFADNTWTGVSIVLPRHYQTLFFLRLISN